MKSQRILKITIALLIVLCSLFSMTSCLIDIGAFYQDMMENQGGDEGGWTPGTPIFPNPDNDSKEDNKEDNKVEQPGEFYPGSGSASTENVPALQQTLLSTVSIISTTSSGVSLPSQRQVCVCKLLFISFIAFPFLKPKCSVIEQR